MVDIDIRKELATEVVRAWYQGVPGLDRTPTYREVAQAIELVEREGEDDVLAALPVLVELMRKQWPDAVRWGAADSYWPVALRTIRQAKQKQVRHHAEAADRARHDREAERDRRDDETLAEVWGPVWEGLGDRERADIERVVLAARPFVGNIPAFKRQMCLRVLAERRGVKS